QQHVALLAALERREVVRRLEVERLDLRGVDEGDDVHGLRGLDVGAAEVLVREHDVAVLLVLVALDHLLPGHFLAGLLVHALVADRREVALVEHAEGELLLFLGRIQPDRNVHQAEADRAFPESSWHGRDDTRLRVTAPFPRAGSPGPRRAPPPWRGSAP